MMVIWVHNNLLLKCILCTYWFFYYKQIRILLIRYHNLYTYSHTHILYILMSYINFYYIFCRTIPIINLYSYIIYCEIYCIPNVYRP